MIRKILSLILSFSLILTQPIFAQGVSELNIGKYLNQMPAVKPDSFRPPHLRYISYNIKSNDFKLLLDQGDAKLSNSLNSSTPKLQDATQELFNYFLIGLSLPNEKFWVNLRPDAPQQIIDPLLEKTDMGKIMLEADLQLKKDISSLTSPQNPEGKEYWDKLYKKAGELFGTENITIPTITRPWIVPGEVIIRESEDSAYIYKANLKVMLEEDYLKSSQQSSPNYKLLTSNYNFSDPRLKELNQYSTQLIRELILPKLTKEVNNSQRYARLRQVFFSLILSRWFKDKFKDKPGQYSQLIDSRNLDKLTSKDPWAKDYYFNEYKKSFQQGEYNLKEQITTPTGQVIRSYVSGGVNVTGEAASPLIGGGYKAIKTTLYVFLLTSLGFLSVPGNLALAKTSLEIGDERALLPGKYLWTGQDIRSLIIDGIGEKILRKSRIDLLVELYNKKYKKKELKTLEDMYMWAVEIEKSNPVISKEIKDKINKLEEEIQLIFNTRSKDISKILDTFKYKLAGMRAEDMGVGSLPEELKRGFAEALRNIEKSPDIFLDWIDEAVTRIREAPGKERSVRESLKVSPFSEKFETLFWDTELGLRNERLGIIEDIYQFSGIGSSPITLTDAKAELENISNEYSGILNVATDDMLENILTSDTLEVFLERMLIVTSIIAYKLAHSKKSSEVFKSKAISALIKLMGKCKYGKQLSNDEEIIKEMKAVFVRKMERLNAISSKYLGDKTYPSRDAYAKEMKEVAHRDVETPKKAELKKIISSFEKNFSISKYVTVFPQNLTMVGDLAVTDISEYLELKILQHAITKASSSLEAVLDIKNQETGNEVGGIDFRRIDYLTRPMGSFQGLDLRLPLLSKAELEGIDINREVAAIEQMVKAKIDVSADRLKRLLAAMSQKDAFNAQRETQLLPLLLRLCWLKEERGVETTPDFRAVLLIADTGLFVEQGNTKYSLN